MGARVKQGAGGGQHGAHWGQAGRHDGVESPVRASYRWWTRDEKNAPYHKHAELQGVPKKAAIKFLDFGPFLVFWTTPEAQIKKKIKAVPFNLIQDQ